MSVATAIHGNRIFDEGGRQHLLHSMGTRHTLEDLCLLVEGKSLKVPIKKHAERVTYVIETCLEIFTKAREGFDKYDEALEKRTLLEPSLRMATEAAWHFTRHLGHDRNKAEAFVRAIEKALKGYHEAIEAEQTPCFIFKDEVEQGAILKILQELTASAAHGFFGFPNYDGPRIIVHRD